MSGQENIKKLIFTYSRRLQKLKEQQALHGLDTAPAILIETEDIEARLETLATSLEKLQSGLDPEFPAEIEQDLARLEPGEQARPQTQLGGLNISGMSGGAISVQGNIDTGLKAEGDVVAGDKVTHIHYHDAEAPAEEKPRLPFEPELVKIPAGDFILGTDDGLPYEGPAHTVYLPTFYIGQYPVTNREFAAFIEETGKVVPSLGWSGQRPAPEQELLPVTGVTWHLALEYCTWLSEQSGRAYALPTEAEWEKAARGPDGRRYPWGDTWQAARANNDPAQLTPVNYFPAQSVYGCYDMVGNGREWTCSLWGSQPRRPEVRFGYHPSDDMGRQAWSLSSPRHNLAANSQVRRIYRGGTGPTPEHLRCTLRRANMPATRLDLTQHGLRLVRRED